VVVLDSSVLIAWPRPEGFRYQVLPIIRANRRECLTDRKPPGFLPLKRRGRHQRQAHQRRRGSQRRAAIAVLESDDH
jgi:hypothetical protein